MDLQITADRTAEWLREFGMGAVLVSLLISVVISILGIVPSLFLSAANALVFGLIPGFFVSLAGETLGAGISFYLYRWGIRKAVKLRADNLRWLKRLNGAGKRKQFMIILFARLTPLIPSGIITFIASLSNIAFVNFLVASFIGKAPSIALETLVGHDLIRLDENYPRLAASLLFIVLIVWILNRSGQKERR